MKKSIIGMTIVIASFSVVAILATILLTGGADEIGKTISGDSSDIIRHARQYDLLYSLRLENSLPAECDWEKFEFSDSVEFPSEEKLNIYKAGANVIELKDLSEKQSKQKFTSEKKAVEAFFQFYPEVENIVSYDYAPQVINKYLAAYEKIPLFSKTNNIKILSTQLGVWRDKDAKYVAGLFESGKSFTNYSFDPQNVYLSFPAKDESKMKKALSGGKIKFMNHIYACEGKNLGKSIIDSVEIVYLSMDSYLVPIYKINGRYAGMQGSGVQSSDIQESGVQNSNIQESDVQESGVQKGVRWTGLVNAVDYESLDFTSYADSNLGFEFTPRPFIKNVTLKDDKYFVNGKLSNNLEKDEKVLNFDLTQMTFHALEETGEYYWGDKRRKSLQKEIDESLTVSGDGDFSFSFKASDFWMVEEKIYEDSAGNKLDEPMHSPNDEMRRPDIHNHLWIKSCGEFNGEEFCSRKSEEWELGSGM